ncbi:hypothetical protein GF342_02815 [Candidatus Woesearchaeota archaeon]|nr:hypothetical protein [Candidatus Woesearchaeota archaeon]
MSLVTLIIIHRQHIFVMQSHYRVIEDLIDQGPEQLRIVRSKGTLEKDAGYIIYDANESLIINGQHAFPVVKQGFTIIHAL